MVIVLVCRRKLNKEKRDREEFVVCNSLGTMIQTTSAFQRKMKTLLLPSLYTSLRTFKLNSFSSIIFAPFTVFIPHILKVLKWYSNKICKIHFVILMDLLAVKVTGMTTRCRMQCEHITYWGSLITQCLARKTVYRRNRNFHLIQRTFTGIDEQSQDVEANDYSKPKTKTTENPHYIEENELSILGHLEDEVQSRNLEIPRDCITVTRVRLGRGQFGEVRQVLVRRPNEPEILCAAKSARGMETL